MTTYTCAVIAAGSQGRVHAQGYLAAQALGARLVAVADPNADAARVLAADLGIPAVYDNALLSGLAQGFWQPTGEQHSTY